MPIAYHLLIKNIQGRRRYHGNKYPPIVICFANFIAYLFLNLWADLALIIGNLTTNS